MAVRTTAALALVALLAAPLAAGAQTRRTPKTQAAAPAAAPATDALSLGGFIGYEWGDQVSGLQLRADGEMPFQQLSPQVKLSFVGSLGFTHETYSVTGLDVTVNRVKIVPAARFTVPLSPQLSLFGDAGLGLHYTHVTSDIVFFGKVTDSGIGFMMRFGGGGFFQVNPQLRILGEFVVDPTFGTYHETSVALLVGAMFRI